MECGFKMNNEDLIKIAINARENAWVPISKFKVGAALLCENGEVYGGCNIEDTSGIGVTNCCAERVAILKAVSDGNRDFVKIAVVGGTDKLIHATPCGVCRQYMNSYNPNLEVICYFEDGIIEYLLKDLLPEAFSEKF